MNKSNRVINTSSDIVQPNQDRVKLKPKSSHVDDIASVLGLCGDDLKSFDLDCNNHITVSERQAVEDKYNVKLYYNAMVITDSKPYLETIKGGVIDVGNVAGANSGCLDLNGLDKPKIKQEISGKNSYGYGMKNPDQASKKGRASGGSH